MGLKRNKRRKTKQTYSKVKDFGFGKIIKKIDRAISILDKK